MSFLFQIDCKGVSGKKEFLSLMSRKLNLKYHVENYDALIDCLREFFYYSNYRVFVFEIENCENQKLLNEFKEILFLLKDEIEREGRKLYIKF